MEDAVLIGHGMVEGIAMTVAVQDFAFMGGSLGMAAGEALITAMMTAVKRKTPFILFAASGGARMQEGILSLMQMPRVTVAVQMLKEAKLPYIVVLTNPTTGGVTASYAMLGDIHIAEPEALICFAGPRVIEQTIREKMPEGFQRSEFLQEHGMIDMVVSRLEMRETIARIVGILIKQPARKPLVEEDEDDKDEEIVLDASEEAVKDEVNGNGKTVANKPDIGQQSLDEDNKPST
jgi:acetyl-CoA carboxylase carboxyl transferase subunit beta